MTKHSIVIAGSTEHTCLCAEALLQSGSWDILAVLTPRPKPVGRKKEIVLNPLHEWADLHNLPVILVADKISSNTKSHLAEALDGVAPDVLLVVDFGYFVPNWLLAWPKVAPVNIHPSTLPLWRGSSPGQFAVLSGAQDSAVSLIHMNSALDQGDLYYQLPFAVDPDWTAGAYYEHAFSLVAAQLSQLLTTIADGSAERKPQPIASPTPTARKLTKLDGFLSWETMAPCLQAAAADAPADYTAAVTAALAAAEATFAENPVAHSLLTVVCSHLDSKYHSLCLHLAVHALSPWPRVWTLLPTIQGPKRMQILSTIWTDGKLQLETVLVEGKTAASWRETKAIVV